MGKFDNQKFESGRQDYETPESIFNPLNEEFNFDLDVCATSENAKCKKYFTTENNGLTQKWTGTCWMNPPFKDVGLWVRKAYEESGKGTTIVCLIASRTNTNWWHQYVMKADEIRFIKGRPKFVGCIHGLPLPLSIVIFSSKCSKSAQLKIFEP